MIIETHPFNSKVGLATISTETKKLLVGTFPAFEVTNMQNPRLNFYYGSNDSKFWDILQNVFPNLFMLTTTSIIDFLKENKIGIIDIIEMCYRKNNRSSEDKDLTIIEQFDFIKLLQTTNCRDIYTTSQLVTKLIKSQLKPIAVNFSTRVVQINQFKYESWTFRFSNNEPPYELRVFSLYSPSDNALRGIKKGLNNNGNNTMPTIHRMNQYSELLNA